MLQKLIGKRLAGEERKLGVPGCLDYVRHMARHSFRSLLKFGKVMPLEKHRRVLPVNAYHVARFVAARCEDCGVCVQIALNQAHADGVAAQVLAPLASGDAAALTAELREVWNFTEAVVKNTGDEEALRPALQKRYGEEGVIEMALAIAIGRVFPTAKRALGFAGSCAATPPHLPEATDDVQ